MTSHSALITNSHALLPQGKRVAILGGTSDLRTEAEHDLASTLGAQLALWSHAVLLTDGLQYGFAEAASRAFAGVRAETHQPPHLVHISPPGSEPAAPGATVVGGRSLEQCLDVLASVADCCIVIDDSPTTTRAAHIARARGAQVLTVSDVTAQRAAPAADRVAALMAQLFAYENEPPGGGSKNESEAVCR